MPRGVRHSTGLGNGPDLRALLGRPLFSACLIALVLGAAWLFDQRSRFAPDRAPRPATSATGAAPAGGTRALWPGNSGCLEPLRWSVEGSLALERGGAGDGWNPSAAGGRLALDPCGAVWALWFNGWAVVQPGDPDRVGSVQLPRSGATDEIARQGVASFAFDGQRALWVLGRNGAVLRHAAASPWTYDDNGKVAVIGTPDWVPLPALSGCHDGQLLRWRQEMWVACPFVAPFDAPGTSLVPTATVLRWNESGQRWIGADGAPSGARRLAVDARERLWSAAPGALARLDRVGGKRWVTARGDHGAPTALATLPDGLAVGTERGLWLYDSEGQLRSAELNDVHVSGLAVEGGRLWVATWRQGLYLREREQWYRWRFAQGLPDDLVRDVLADRRGRLWLGSAPGGWMLATAAATKIKQLPPPSELLGRRFADACAAAHALLAGGEGVSGAIARANFENRPLVFFNGQQACPIRPEKQAEMPVFWRRSDGWLLELAYNGRGGSRFGDGAQMADFWSVRVHQPLSGGGWFSKTLPLPNPLPAESPGALAQLDARGQVWIATGQSGIWQFDGQAWRQHAAAAGYGIHNRPQALLADAEGMLWVGSSPSWLFQEQRHAGPALQRWQDDRWHAAGLEASNLSVFALAAGAGLRWIGDNGKLWRLGPEGITALQDEVLRRRGLITDIAIDDQGQPWLTHGVGSEGLSHHDGERTRIVTSREGLFSDDIALLGFDDQQRLWLQAATGVVAVYERAALLDASH